MRHINVHIFYPLASTFMLIFLAACQISNQAPSSTVEAENYQTTVPTLQNTLSSPLVTPMPLTSTPTFSQWERKQQCLVFDNSSPEIGEGIIVGLDSNFHLLSFNLATRHTTLLSDSNVIAKISPDGKWIAYYPTVGQDKKQSIQLTVLSSDGNIHKSFPWQADWSTFSWVNDHKILIGKTDMDQSSGTLTALILLDIETGQQSELSPKFPSIFQNHPPLDLINWENSWPFVYDPTLTRVVYAKTGNAFPTVSLWDPKNSQELTSVNVVDFNLYATQPKWSYTGDRFVISALFLIDKNKSIYGNDLFSISRDAQMNRLTYFTDELGNSTAIIRDYKWSPNSGYIALWMKSQNEALSFGILDVSSDTFIDYCLQDAFDASNTTSLTWSPDSNFILITFIDQNQELKTILIDRSNNTAIEIVKNTIIPIGWLSREP